MVLEPDGTYEVFFDMESKAQGKIVDGWAFPDPAAAKPEGYDDIPAEIPDPEAETPEDWDEDEDGAWEPPMIDNPDYKGEWKAPMVDNPEYKGAWVHPMIPNKAYAPETYAKYKDLTTA